MKQLYVITKNELLRYFISPLAYVYLVSFLLLNGACCFYFGHFFERGEASLETMFIYQPWLYLLFVSGISMRLWAEEFRNRTIVQMMTMPVSVESLVWGKFWASLIFCALALGLTFPFWITVNILGNPDNGVIALSYLGSLTLAGCMLAVSQTMSALTKNQVIALVLAVAANLIFFWSGLEFVLSLFRLFLPDYMIDAIASFSFISHFTSICRGVLELRDILFFVSVIVLFNFTTVLIVSFRTSGTAGWLKSSSRALYIWAWMMLMIGFMGFNLLANNLTRGVQIDVTEDKLYTLNPDTVRLLQNLPEPVTAKLYYSPLLGQRSPEMRRIFDKVRQLLVQYKTASNGRFDYRIYYPKTLDRTEDRAIGDGLQPIPLIDLNQNTLFGLTFTDAVQNKRVIPMFTTGNTSAIEQEMSSKIYQLSWKKRKLALLSSLPLNGEGGTAEMVFQPWEIYNRIAEFYDIKNIKEPQDLDDRPDVLMIVHPLGLSDDMIEAVKKYSKNYGNILLLLDGAAESRRLYSSVNHPYQSSDLKGLDTFWGFKFYNDFVVADLDNSVMVDATVNYKTNPAFTQDIIQFKLKPDNFSPLHPITRNLKSMLMSSVSVLAPISEDVYFLPLLQSGQNSSLMSIKVVYDGLNPRQVLTYFEPDDNTKILAAGISGKTNDNPFNLIVVGDTDFLYNSFWTKPVSILDQTYNIPLFGNADFLLNALDYLANDPYLLNLRGKSARPREFTDIEKERKQNLLTYKLKEEEIFEKIDQTKAQLEEITGKRIFENRETFTADELSLIKGIRQKLDTLRNDLSEIRHQSTVVLQKYATKLKFINIFAVPMLLLLVLGLYAFFHRTKHHCTLRFRFEEKALKLSGMAFLILLLGLMSVYTANRSDIQKYEDTLALPDLQSHINDVAQIRLMTHDETLTFINEDGEWSLLEYPDLPVYQERIRYLLQTLLRARLYEKKSDKAENLFRFGLGPVETDDSPNTRLELLDRDGTLLDSLEIGTYNMDLGRGSKSAYVKFDDRFQVWLAEADFVDLRTDYTQWTYASLWNLRFGRLISFNGNNNPTDVANIARELLNTYMIERMPQPENAQHLGTLSLQTEYADPIVLRFDRSDDLVVVSYEFPQDISQDHLQLFEKYVKGRFLTIPTDQWEKIKNAAKL